MNDASASVLPMGWGRKQRVKEGWELSVDKMEIGLILKKNNLGLQENLLKPL